MTEERLLRTARPIGDPEDLAITPGPVPEGLNGTVVGEFWKSGLCGPRGKPDLRMDFDYGEEYGGWFLRIQLWRKDGKAIEGQRAYKFAVPKTVDELAECILAATDEIRKVAKLPEPHRRSVIPPMPGNVDLAAQRAFKTGGAGRG